MVGRKEYLERLVSFREKQLIKVITGVRRCGKSTLMEQYKDYLRSDGVEERQIISVNLEDMDYWELLDYHKLYQYMKERLCPDCCTYVFIDEVQQCRGFEHAVDSLFIKKNVDVYITGSNAYMLSGELATLLSGRYVEIEMLPFSYREYREACGGSGLTEQQMFQRYMRYGAFPYVTELEPADRVINDYLEGIYHTILMKDVATREKITDITLLDNIVKYLCANSGSPVSAKRISDTLVSSGRKIVSTTVEHYLRALVESFIFYRVDRYDIKGKNLLKTLGKYYMVDTGLRNLLVTASAADTGHLLENIVYLELLRRGYRVSIGKLAEKEVDFVASRPDGIEYYQVSSTVLDEETLRRELEPLEKIRDHYPKYLLTLDEIGAGNNYEGIRQLNVIEWLSGNEWL